MEQPKKLSNQPDYVSDRTSLYYGTANLIHRQILTVVCFVSDCESLVRKILVRDPARRYTIEAVKRHRWMRAEVPKTVRTDFRMKKRLLI